MKQSSFQSLKKSMKEGLDFAQGRKVKGTNINEYIVHEPKGFTAEEIKSLRISLQISQPIFAQILGVSVNALRNWEQDRNSPSMMARRFLEVIENDPSKFIGLVKKMEIIEQTRMRA